MQSNRTRRSLAGAFTAGLLILCGATASASADPITVNGGATPLPASGLIVDLPLRKNVEYHVSSSWALSDNSSFDARDIVDEFDAASGAIKAGNWILTGYFDAGGCNAVLGEETLDKAWQTEADIWGQHWNVRGGIYTFENSSLGRRPAAVLCTSIGDSDRSFLLYRFLVDQPETLDQASLLADAKSSVVLERAWNSYRDHRIEDIRPLKRQEVRNRGSISAARTITLGMSNLKVDLPDDGYVWLAHEADSSDMLDRMAPSLPDVSIEVIAVEGQTCADLLAGLKTDIKAGHTARSLPAGWIAGEAMVVDGNIEMPLCHSAGYGSLLAGVLQGPDNRDISRLHPLLGALERATRIP